VRALVEQTGHEVVGEAPDAPTAIDRIPSVAPDIVVIDWEMPRLDGIEATRRIRRNHPDIQVIAFTSTTDPRVHAGFLEAGAQAHVTKDDIRGLRDALTACEA
jgi:CheY-like chemotaxis protein